MNETSIRTQEEVMPGLCALNSRLSFLPIYQDSRPYIQVGDSAIHSFFLKHEVVHLHLEISKCRNFFLGMTDLFLGV